MLSSLSPAVVPGKTFEGVHYDPHLASASKPKLTVEIPIILCPLYNLGNTCYFNAGVQLLVNCPQFVYCLRDSMFRHPQLGRHVQRIGRSCGKAALALFEAFTDLVNKMEFSELDTDHAVSPLGALNCLSAVHPLFEGREQQDCPEMVNAVIANIAEVGRQEVELDDLLESFESDYMALEKTMTTQGGEASVMALRFLRRRGECDDMSLQSVSLCGNEKACRNGATPINHLPDGVELESDPFAVSVAPQCWQLPLSPGSWWNFNTMKIVQLVNRENKLLQLREDSKIGKSPQCSFRPPKVFYNSVTDGFTGQILSEIRCHTCQKSSRIVENFSSLTIGIPSPCQRLQYAKRHPEVRRVKKDGTPQNLTGVLYWRSLFSWFYTATRWIFGLITGFSSRGNCPVTLQECLDIHFEPVELKGSNMYHCSTCNGKREATKRETLLTMPEYLLLHMKRFEQGRCFSTKKTDAVTFPLSWDVGAATSAEVLRLHNYLDKNVLTLRPPFATFTDMGSMEDSTPMENSTSAATPLATSNDFQMLPSSSSVPMQGTHTGANSDFEVPIDSYTLEAVVNHHGSIARGHYTTFARKKTSSKDVWVYFNDDEMSTTDLESVANSQEYLLLYRKQSLYPRSETFERLRKKAQKLLAKPLSSTSTLGSRPTGMEGARKSMDGSLKPNMPEERDEDCEMVYISRLWLQRMMFMEEPGPILNRLTYSSECQQTGDLSLSDGAQNPTEQNVWNSSSGKDSVYGKSLPVEWFYVPLMQREYDAFYNVYGGNRSVTQTEYDLMMAKQEKLL